MLKFDKTAEVHPDGAEEMVETPGLCLQDEGANAGSKVAASLFLSPGGPKFTSLMLSLANHVMLQEMKTFNTGACSTWVPHACIQVGLMIFDGFDRGQLGS